MRARVHKHRLAQRQARQVKDKRENRYVIKVKGKRFLRFVRTKGCNKPFHWLLIIYSILL